MGQYLYKASIAPCDFETMKERGQKWRPSIHMPKYVSRIWLEITDIRVERVQGITEEQSISEGIMNGLVSWADKPIVWFQRAWDSIYKNWADNPWVWVVEFKRVER